MNSGDTLIKIIRSDKCHNGFTYKIGLNILDKPFEPKGSCVPGGLYYTNIDNIPDYYGYGELLVTVRIPDDAQVVQDPCIHSKKWRTDKIILCEEYPLFDPETIKKFNLKITPNYIDSASMYGHIDVLEWLKNSELQLAYSNYAMDLASEFGHINVLEWWKNSGLQLEYSMSVMDCASGNGHINVLEWWKNSGLPLKYSDKALEWASGGGHINVLEWWKNSGLPLKYSDRALDLASGNGRIDVLEWWKNSGLPLKYSEDTLDCASGGGHINVLEWWKNSGLPLKYF
uniref:Uncharacterized protein n=1 Tax=viral metagenome TaxID=1070528 RepID=A0A6C0E5U3_9ZZZZ